MRSQAVKPHKISMIAAALAAGLAVSCQMSDAQVNGPNGPPGTVTLSQIGSLSVGDAEPMSATVRADDGSVISNPVLTWSSDNPAVALTTPDGRVVGVSAGSANITVTSQGESDSKAVTVQSVGGERLLYYSSLDSNGSIMNPLVGNGAPSFGPTPFSHVSIAASEAAQISVNAGMLVNRLGQRFEVDQMGPVGPNIYRNKGTVEFWFKPAYASNNNNKYTLFGSGDWWSPGSFHLGKLGGGGNLNTLFLIWFDKDTPVPPPTQGPLAGIRFGNNVVEGSGPTEYRWSANEWVHIRLTWDFTDTGRIFHFYLDGVDKQIVANSTSPLVGPFDMGIESTSNFFYLGSRPEIGGQPSNFTSDGVFDEIKIYSEVVPPN